VTKTRGVTLSLHGPASLPCRGFPRSIALLGKLSGVNAVRVCTVPFVRKSSLLPFLSRRTCRCRAFPSAWPLALFSQPPQCPSELTSFRRRLKLFLVERIVLTLFFSRPTLRVGPYFCAPPDFLPLETRRVFRGIEPPRMRAFLPPHFLRWVLSTAGACGRGCLSSLILLSSRSKQVMNPNFCRCV